MADGAEIAFAVIVVMAAGFVRGYGGFGFALIATAGLSLVWSPLRIVPAVLIMDTVASLVLLAGVYTKVQWRVLGWLYPGVIVGTPIGAWGLGHLPETPLRIAIAFAIFCLALLLRQEVVFRRPLGRSGMIGTGFISGMLNGGAAIGGPPAILFFFASPAGADVSRASLIAFFLGTDVLALAACLAMELVSLESGLAAAWLTIPLGIGLATGTLAFRRTPQKRFRQHVLLILAGLAFMSLGRSVWPLLGG